LFLNIGTTTHLSVRQATKGLSRARAENISWPLRAPNMMIFLPTLPFCFTKHFYERNWLYNIPIPISNPAPQWILNCKRSLNSPPKCELSWENATPPRPLAAYLTHMDTSFRGVRYASSVSSDLTPT
jgi:hypothetical protein